MDLSINDDDLIEKSKAGDLNAFEALIARYEKKVYTIAFRFMGNQDDAKDLAQEAFIRVYKSLNNFRGESSFLTWLYHIISNLCKDELRKQQKKKTISLEIVRETKKNSPTASVNLPEENYIRKEKQQALQEVINTLPIDYKWIIIMREFQQFSYEEIAAQIGCSIGTVKSRLNRGRQLLRDGVLKREEIFNESSTLGERRG